MTLFVDTSVWSLALRRDQPADAPAVRRLSRALETGERLVTTGLVLQELLQGFYGPKAHEQIVERLSALPLVVPDREDHVAAQRCAICAARGAYKLKRSMRCLRSCASATSW